MFKGMLNKGFYQIEINVQNNNNKMYVLKCPKNFTMKLSYNFIKITHKQKKSKGGVAAKYSFYKEGSRIFFSVLFTYFHTTYVGLYAVDYDFWYKKTNFKPTTMRKTSSFYNNTYLIILSVNVLLHVF